MSIKTLLDVFVVVADLKITAKRILQVESFKCLDGIQRRVGVLSLDIEVVLGVDKQSLSNNFHQKARIGWTEETKMLRIKSTIEIVICTYFCSSPSTGG